FLLVVPRLLPGMGASPGAIPAIPVGLGSLRNLNLRNLRDLGGWSGLCTLCSWWSLWSSISSTATGLLLLVLLGFRLPSRFALLLVFQGGFAHVFFICTSASTRQRNTATR